MSFSWWTFGLQAVNFLVLVWLLRRFLFKPVTAMVARRKEEIARGMAEVAAEKQTAPICSVTFRLNGRGSKQSARRR